MAFKYNTKKLQRWRRHRRLRRKISGSAGIPRCAVHLTARHINIQFIDDEAGVTLAAASTMGKDFEGRANVDGAKAIGKVAGDKAKAAGIEKVVFDRGGFQYHGRVKAVADAIREAGIKF